MVILFFKCVLKKLWFWFQIYTPFWQVITSTIQGISPEAEEEASYKAWHCYTTGEWHNHSCSQSLCFSACGVRTFCDEIVWEICFSHIYLQNILYGDIWPKFQMCKELINCQCRNIWWKMTNFTNFGHLLQSIEALYLYFLEFGTRPNFLLLFEGIFFFFLNFFGGVEIIIFMLHA